MRLRLPSSLRHGLANLYRPGNQSAPVLAALGTGVMLILAVYLMQKDLLRDLHETAAPSLPNVFLVDIRTGEVDGVKAFFAHQAGVNRPLNLIPVVMGRFISINGEQVDQMEGQHYPRRMLQNAELSWADTPPEGDKVTAGSWWTSSSTSEIAVSEGVARRLHIGVGSAMELETGGTTRALKVAAIYRADGQHLGARVQFVLPSGLISNEPSTWYGGMRIDPNRVPEMERAFFAAYPTITVVNVADVLQRIEGVVDQITFVVRLLAGFSILAGLTILASSIASTRFRRMQEAVVLKTLGATRMRIVRTFSVEFSVLGLLAGTVGVVFANLLTRVLLHRLEIVFHIEWTATMRGAGRNCDSGHGHGMDRELPDSWPAAPRGLARRVAIAGTEQGTEDVRLIFIYGLPATGKLTVARELASLTGYKLFHNHLAVDLLLSVFEFGSAPFVELREEIWLSIFEQSAQSNLLGLIFTFAPESTVRPQFVLDVSDTIARAEGRLDFVELTCPMPELKRRIGDASRREHGKLTSRLPFRAASCRRSFRRTGHAQPGNHDRHGSLHTG